MTSNLTHGKIWKSLLVFALPLLASSLVQQLYNTVDLIYVGQYLGKDASSAIGASSLLTTCMVGFFGGMSVGSGVVIAQIFGSGRLERLRKAVHNALALSIVGGVVLMIFGYFFAPYFLIWMNTPESIQPSAVSYLRIYFISLISVLTYNIGAGVLRALGDSKTPLYAQLVGGVLNVVMDAVFIILFDDGVNGVAWATLFSQTTAAVYVVYRLTKLDSSYALKFRDIRFDKPILCNVLKIGVPAGAQSLLITLSNVMAQYHINNLGVNELDVSPIAAFTNYFKVELVLYLPIVAMGQAIMTFVAQNWGAQNYSRVRKGTRVCLIMGVCFTALCSILALAFGDLLFRAFTPESDVIALGVRIISVTFPFYFIYTILQVLGDSLRGAGKTNPPMLIIMLNICVIRTILLFILVPRLNTVESVAMTYPITWALTAICMSVYYLHFHKKNQISLAAKPEAAEV